MTYMETLKSTISSTLSNVCNLSKNIIVDLIGVIFSTIGRRILKIDDEIVMSVIARDNNIDFYLHPIIINEIEQNIGMNKLIIHDGVINDTIMSIPKKFWSASSINIDYITLSCVIQKRPTSLYYTTTEDQNHFINSHETDEDIINIIKSIRNILFSYFDKITIFVKSITIKLNNLEILIENTYINHNSVFSEKIEIINIMLIEKIQFTDKIDIDTVTIKSDNFNILPDYYIGNNKSDINLTINKLLFDDVKISNLSLISNTISLSEIIFDTYMNTNNIEIKFDNDVYTFVNKLKIIINDSNILKSIYHKYFIIYQTLQSHMISDELKMTHIKNLNLDFDINNNNLIFMTDIIINDSPSLINTYLEFKNHIITCKKFTNNVYENLTIDSKSGLESMIQILDMNNQIYIENAYFNLINDNVIQIIKSDFENLISFESSSSEKTIIIKKSKFKFIYESFDIMLDIDESIIKSDLKSFKDLKITNTIFDIYLHNNKFASCHVENMSEKEYIFEYIHLFLDSDILSELSLLLSKSSKYQSEKSQDDRSEINLSLLEDALNNDIQSHTEINIVEDYIDKIIEVNYIIEIKKSRMYLYLDNQPFLSFIFKNTIIVMKNMNNYDLTISDGAIIDHTCGNRKWKYFLRKRSRDSLIKLSYQMNESVNIELIVADISLQMREIVFSNISKFMSSMWQIIDSDTVLISRFRINAIHIILSYDSLMNKNDLLTVVDYSIYLPEAIIVNSDGTDQLLKRYLDTIKHIFDYNDKLQFIPHLKAIKTILLPLYSANDHLYKFTSDPSTKKTIKEAKKSVKVCIKNVTKLVKYVAYYQINK